MADYFNTYNDELLDERVVDKILNTFSYFDIVVVANKESIDKIQKELKINSM